MREIVLEARAVTRTYGTGTGATHALRGVDVEIEQGRFTAIIGASGCGKSTLLQALGGLDAPTSGKVLLEGQDLYALPDAALARLRRTRLGFVFQAFHLLPEYTVRDNILLPLLLDKREPDEEYLALLTRQLGLTALLQRQPTQLSGGQQQRAALARILVGKPSILMLDEPFSALDSYLREEVEGEVGSLLAGFASSFSNRLLVTHGTAAVAAMAAAGKTTMVISMIAMAICMGCQPLLAYSYGAGDSKRLKQLLKDLILLTVVFGVLAGAASFAGRNALIGMFIKEEGAFRLGTQLVVYLVLGSPVIGLTYLVTNLLQSVGKASGAVVLSLLRQGLLLIPLLYLMNALYGVQGIAAAHLMADVSSAVISAVILLHWLRASMEKKAEV